MEENSLESRVSKLEWSLDKQTEDINHLSETMDRLKKSLYGIERTLIQIRWFAMGGIALYIADQFGLTKILQLIS